MTLDQRLDHDLKEAMKNRDEKRLSLLRLLKNAIKNAEIAKRSALEEAEIIRVLEKQAKERRDSIECFKSGNRPELAEKEAYELSLIEKYLPVRLDKQAVEAIIDEVIKELAVTELFGMGQVIKTTVAKSNGAADGKMVADLVRQKLA